MNRKAAIKIKSAENQALKLERKLVEASYLVKNDSEYDDLQYYSGLLRDLRNKFSHLFDEAKENIKGTKLRSKGR